jgi:hypothetical protein
VRALAVALAVLVAAPAADAAFFRGTPVDAADAPGDVDLARDGDGALAYLKGGHVFVSALTRGAAAPPVQVDGGQALASSQPRVAAAGSGRVLVVWLNDGRLWASLRARSGAPFSSPVVAYSAQPVDAPVLSMTNGGKAYVAFTTPAGEARYAYMAADGSWSAPDAPLDVDPAQAASGATVAASGDGTAMFAWTESGADSRTHVFMRRAVGTRPSSAAPEASVPSLDFRAGGNADSPSVGIELDSAHAWVAFRQDFLDGGAFTSRALGRRLLGSAFDDPPFGVDGLSFPAGAGADGARVALTGGRRGTFSASLRAPAGITGMLLKNDVRGPVQRLGIGRDPVPTAADDGSGTVVWRGDFGLVGRHFDPARLDKPATIAGSPTSGLESSGDANGNAAITFLQGGRAMLALYDAPPRSPHAHDEKRWQHNPRPRFHWSTVTDGWSRQVTYKIQIDKKTWVTTTKTTWYPPRPVPNGDHRWRIVTIDSRGQETIGRERHLRIRR